jgi:hypothetical protein
MVVRKGEVLKYKIGLKVVTTRRGSGEPLKRMVGRPWANILAAE